jgi:predicted RNA polymerase sigma factor
VVLQVLYLIFNEGYTTSSGPNLHRAELTGEAIRLTRAVQRLLPDWPQILALYELLERIAPNPMVTLNRAVAAAMVHGPQAGLDLLRPLDDDARLAGHHRLEAVRAHLLELAGDLQAARASYQLAARRTTSLPEQRYLQARAARLAPRSPQP